jgi:hypothetical protein
MEKNGSTTAPAVSTVGKMVRWILAGAAMLLIGFTVYSAVMRKFGAG